MPDDLTESVNRLRDRVKQVFADVRPPSDDNIISHSCERCLALKSAFRKELHPLWTEVPKETIEANYDNLPLLSPEALHFFLPAFLTYGLENWGSEVWFYTLCSLTPGKEEESHAERWHWRFSCFSVDQVEVLFAFLNLVLQDPESYFHYTAIERGIKRLRKYLDLP